MTPDYSMFSPDSNLLPDKIIWDNYRELFSGGQRGARFFTGMFNSLRAAAITLVIGIPVALMSAYALGRMQFRGRKAIKNILLITMVIPVMATIIPLYRMFADARLLDNIFWLSFVCSDYFVYFADHVFEYLESVPDSFDLGFFYGDKADGHRGIRICYEGYHSVRPCSGGRYDRIDSSCTCSAGFPEIFGIGDDERFCKRVVQEKLFCT